MRQKDPGERKPPDTENHREKPDDRARHFSVNSMSSVKVLPGARENSLYSARALSAPLVAILTA